jgi:hypothetical protein
MCKGANFLTFPLDKESGLYILVIYNEYISQ